ncbi:oxidoreductase [Halalkalibacter alkalisediminis]|uniref:NADPH dehydrogenase n=1 Tax=Halalkalibacter alkalisediminis TaxID=935616 RepID=A0ABV6NH53_9BACI|nr:NADPH dehydrogenase [Halalkalibacter alkalisediminis]
MASLLDPYDWHYSHYTSRAIGGTSLIIIEMTDVEPDGRISDYDLGIWEDDHVPAFERIIRACQSYGAKVAIQIAHAGRKAEDAVVPVSSTSTAFSDRFNTPKELSTAEAEAMVVKFEQAFKRAVQAGVDAIEIHGAHGYLIHQFHSPFTNKRSDKYGQDRALFGKEMIQAARRLMPECMPLIFRISAVEYAEEGYQLDYSINLVKEYREAGIDLFHISSGGESNNGPEYSGEGYQVDLAASIKKALDVPVIAVGRMENATYSDQVIRDGKADLVAVGRGMLRNPYWANEASLELKRKTIIPRALERGFDI